MPRRRCGTWPPNRRFAEKVRVDLCKTSISTQPAASADFCGQLADDVAQVGDDLGVLPRVLAVQRLELHRQLQVLDDARTGQAERLAGLVVCPHAAVATERPADDGRGLT